MTNPTTAEKVRERDAYEAIDALVEFAGIERRTVFADDHKRVILNYISTLTAELASLQRERDADAARLDWIARQGDEFSSGILKDQPGDGDYYVHCLNAYGTGSTFREAVDTARGAGNGRVE